MLLPISVGPVPDLDHSPTGLRRLILRAVIVGSDPGCLAALCPGSAAGNPMPIVLSSPIVACRYSLHRCRFVLQSADYLCTNLLIIRCNLWCAALPWDCGSAEIVWEDSRRKGKKEIIKVFRVKIESIWVCRLTLHHQSPSDHHQTSFTPPDTDFITVYL